MASTDRLAATNADLKADISGKAGAEKAGTNRLAALYAQNTGTSMFSELSH